MSFRLMLSVVISFAASHASGQIVKIKTSDFASRYATWRADQIANPTETTQGIEAKFPGTYQSRTGQVFEASKVGKERIRALYWRSLDAIVFSAGSLERLTDYALHLDRPVGGHLKAGDVLLALANAIENIPNLRDQPKVDAVRTEWETRYASKAQSALDWIAQLLGLEKRPKQIEIILVPRTVGKEGMTVQSLDGPKVIVAAENLKGPNLVEVILHEALHVLDASNPDAGFLDALRKALVQKKRSDEEVERFPHTLMFVFAAEAVRKFYSPDHVDYGIRNGAYRRGLETYIERAKNGLATLPNFGKALDKMLSDLPTQWEKIDDDIADPTFAGRTDQQFDLVDLPWPHARLVG